MNWRLAMIPGTNRRVRRCCAQLCATLLCVDEKPAIQALERAQGWLRLPNGKALTGFNHEYKRHGTSALEVATGQVKARHFPRRRRREFRQFMNEVGGAYPKRELHVILDNLNTHKPKLAGCGGIPRYTCTSRPRTLPG